MLMPGTPQGRGLRCDIIVTHGDRGGEAVKSIWSHAIVSVGVSVLFLPRVGGRIGYDVAPCALLFTLGANGVYEFPTCGKWWRVHCGVSCATQVDI